MCRTQAAVVASMTRDLRAALVSYTPPPPPPTPSRPPRHTSPSPMGRTDYDLAAAPGAAGAGAGAGRPLVGAAGGGSLRDGLQSFDYVVKQAARVKSSSNCRLLSVKGAGLGVCTSQTGQRAVLEAEGEAEEGCLPVSFLSSTELITVMVPYLKCLLAMHNQQQHSQQGSSSVLMHPGIQKHVSALMGALPAEDDLQKEKESVLIGRHHHHHRSNSNSNTNRGTSSGVAAGQPAQMHTATTTAGFSSNTGYSGSKQAAVQHDETDWDLEDELEEFSD